MPYWAVAVPAMRLFVATLESELRPDADIQSPRFLADILHNVKNPTSGNQRSHCGNARWRKILTNGMNGISAIKLKSVEGIHQSEKGIVAKEFIG